jgi:hypothetical protein
MHHPNQAGIEPAELIESITPRPTTSYNMT